MTSVRIDIFCRVIDNFGDAGVCWRLARQLAGMSQCAGVRLYIDDLSRLAHFQPQVNSQLNLQTVLGVELVRWQAPLPELAVADIVIEAFGCSPDPAYLARMTAQDPLWINLEYLSAEPWVESFHGQPSLQANGVRKFFFFPGFTPATGGLLREADLLHQRDLWRSNPEQRKQLHQQLGLSANAQQALLNGARQVSLFSYPSAPVASLIDSLNHQSRESVVLVPEGVCPTLPRTQHGNVLVCEIPFLDQPGFDRLLWSSDLNCVRGEDSLVRALWAARPLLWHIYPQDDDAHHVKLQAWLDASPLPGYLAPVMHGWNHDTTALLPKALDQALQPNAWQQWEHAMNDWATSLAQHTDLATNLLQFCLQKK
jgi:uncharacterized repeat protein (TIGR03837 family)